MLVSTDERKKVRNIIIELHIIIDIVPLPIFEEDITVRADFFITARPRKLNPASATIGYAVLPLYLKFVSILLLLLSFVLFRYCLLVYTYFFFISFCKYVTFDLL